MIRHQLESSSSNGPPTYVGTYKRTLPAILDWMYENALDWECLSHLYSSCFRSVSPPDFCFWGWSTDVTASKGRAVQLELIPNRSARGWITRNLNGDIKSAENWTIAFVIDEKQLDLVIDFFVLLEGLANRDEVGMACIISFEDLYDEDVKMMSERQFQLDLRLERQGLTKELELSIPNILSVKVLLSGRELLINKEARHWYVYPSRCPRLLGSLEDSGISNGVVICPRQIEGQFMLKKGFK